jgi:hypothetical protein
VCGPLLGRLDGQFGISFWSSPLSYKSLPLMRGKKRRRINQCRHLCTSWPFLRWNTHRLDWGKQQNYNQRQDFKHSVIAVCAYCPVHKQPHKPVCTTTITKRKGFSWLTIVIDVVDDNKPAG